VPENEKEKPSKSKKEKTPKPTSFDNQRDKSMNPKEITKKEESNG